MKIHGFGKTVLLLAVCWQLGACSKSDDSALPHSSPYVDTVFSYTPAPGQFINTSVGSLDEVGKITQNGTITLGAWGGQIILGFDHTVPNKDGNDLKITGNATAQMAEAGIVWVMRDQNGNGLPDDTWYELKGSAYGQPGYRRDYSVTYYKPSAAGGDIRWEASDGTKGVIKGNVSPHDQPYYPDWMTADQYTLKGSVLPSDHIDTSNASFISSLPFDFGYADNTAGGDELDLDNAIDENNNKVILDGIDFVKVQTGVMANLGWLGEYSTELSSIQDLHMQAQ